MPLSAPMSATATCCSSSRQHGGMLGGETSGHILCLDRATTGDGIVAALAVLQALAHSGENLSQARAGLQKLPQVMLNVRAAGAREALAAPRCRGAGEAEETLQRTWAGGVARVRHRAAGARHHRGRRCRRGAAVGGRLADARELCSLVSISRKAMKRSPHARYPSLRHRPRRLRRRARRGLSRVRFLLHQRTRHCMRADRWRVLRVPALLCAADRHQDEVPRSRQWRCARLYAVQGGDRQGQPVSRI